MPLTLAQTAAEQIREQQQANDVRAGTHAAGASKSAGGGSSTGAKAPSSASDAGQVVICKGLEGMGSDGSRVGAARLLEAAQRKLAGVAEWRDHKPPQPGEPCPWVALFGKCTSTTCKRCKGGTTAKADPTCVRKVRAAYEEAAATSDTAKETFASFRTA